MFDVPYPLLIVTYTTGMPQLKKYVSICFDSPGALIALQAAKMASPLVQQCQRELNDISTWYFMGLFWVSELSGVHGTEISDELAR